MILGKRELCCWIANCAVKQEIGAVAIRPGMLPRHRQSTEGHEVFTIPAIAAPVARFRSDIWIRLLAICMACCAIASARPSPVFSRSGIQSATFRPLRKMTIRVVSLL